MQAEDTFGTIEQAVKNANNWILKMRDAGIRYVQIVGEPTRDDELLWLFTIRHSLTGVECTLEIHGLTKDEISARNVTPRTYWNGSSTAEPGLEDFLTAGFYIDIVKI